MPNTNNFNEQWPLVLETFKNKKDQIQHDLEWEEFFLRINHSKTIYMNTKYMEEKQRKKKINDLIKTAIPTKNDKSLKEILVDFAVQQLNGLGLIVNYMYFVSEDVFKQFLDEFMGYCVKRYRNFQKNVNQ
ncbi:hypothetical protein F8M41_014783 [Gigaspora margarita]|uniref:Uncharacterized protein n=1 Tax=Gigaspora margarita TaxID=4874 RepID=A0A8H4ENU0_GIGMA|nr:hypothetical protein F8M41_014783 [Gigaspora margarita]